MNNLDLVELALIRRKGLQGAATVEDGRTLFNQLQPLLDLVEGLAQRLEEAKNQKVVLNGMTQEQKAAIFAIKAIVVDALIHYRQARGECTCVAPPMQPCSPACKYPYTDQRAKGGE